MAKQTAEQLGLAEFELARKKLRGQVSAERSRQQEALKRQFARQGGLGSGAFIKVSQQQQQALGKAEQEATEGLSVAEAREKRRVQELKEGQQFISSERKGAQSFAADQQEQQRAFAAEQQEIQRQFASGEAGKQRGFLSEERLAQQNFTDDQRAKVQQFQSDLERGAQNWRETLHSADMNFKAQQFDMQQRMFDEEVRINNANLELAKAEAGKPTDLASSLLPGGGGGTGSRIGKFGGPVWSAAGGFIDSLF